MCVIKGNDSVDNGAHDEDVGADARIRKLRREVVQRQHLEVKERDTHLVVFGSRARRASNGRTVRGSRTASRCALLCSRNSAGSMFRMVRHAEHGGGHLVVGVASRHSCCLRTREHELVSS
jgi:hypothetical protein